MLNTSQNLNAWQKYFHHPTGAKLGVMNAIFQIGSLVTLPIVSVQPLNALPNESQLTPNTGPFWQIGLAVGCPLLSAVCSWSWEAS